MRLPIISRKGLDPSLNPFANDVDADDMYGLASYEDELITSAADSYLPSASPVVVEKIANGYMSDDKQSANQEEDKQVGVQGSN